MIVNKDNFLFLLFKIFFIYICFQGFVVFAGGLDYNSITNPYIPLWYRISDEILLLLIFILSLILKPIQIRKKMSQNILLFLLLSLVTYILIKEVLIWGEISTVKYIKNVFFTIIFLYTLDLFIKNLKFNQLISFISNVVALSLLISIAHYFIFPYIGYDHRLIGAYASPNTTAMVAVFSIFLSLIVYYLDNNKRYMVYKIFVSFAALVMTVSFFGYMQLIFSYFILLMLNGISKFNILLFKRYIFVLSVFAVAMIIILSEYSILVQQILQKIDLVQNNSTTVNVRVIAYQNWFNELNWASFLFGSKESYPYLANDGSFLNIIQKYGIVGIGIYLSMIWIALYITFKRINSLLLSKSIKKVMLISMIFVLSVFLINGIGQYQIQTTTAGYFIFLMLFMVYRIDDINVMYENSIILKEKN